MKKILFLTTLLFGSLLAGCSDQNEVVRDLYDEIEDRPIVESIPYTLTDADYTAISKAAVKAAGDDAAKKALAQAVDTEKALNSFANGSDFFDDVLVGRFPALDVNSAVQVTYGYREDYLFDVVKPVTIILEEDFEGEFASGWTQFDTSGTREWVSAAYGGNTYAEVTSYGNPKEENNVFLVSPEVDLTGLENPNLSFTAELRFPVSGQNYLRVLVTESYNGAATVWDDVTANFTLPTEQTGAQASAGVFSLADYSGRIRFAFKYQGDDLNASLTTTLRIDNIRVADGLFYDNVVTVTADDVKEMGLQFLSLATAPKYVPAFLARMFPYAQDGDRKAVVYNTSASAKRADEYYFFEGRWAPSISGAGRRTEQYVLSDNGWVFDPTVNFWMSKDDYQLVIDRVLSDPKTEMYVGFGSDGVQRTNEEWYYGFNAYYPNVSFRLSSRDSNKASAEYDTELHELGSDEEKVALLWDRLEQRGLPLFLSLKFPTTPLSVEGVTQMYRISLKVYGYDGVSADSNGKDYSFLYKVTKAGPGPEFEFVEKTEL